MSSLDPVILAEVVRQGKKNDRKPNLPYTVGQVGGLAINDPVALMSDGKAYHEDGVATSIATTGNNFQYTATRTYLLLADGRIFSTFISNNVAGGYAVGLESYTIGTVDEETQTISWTAAVAVSNIVSNSAVLTQWIELDSGHLFRMGNYINNTYCYTYTLTGDTLALVDTLGTIVDSYSSTYMPNIVEIRNNIVLRCFRHTTNGGSALTFDIDSGTGVITNNLNTITTTGSTSGTSQNSFFKTSARALIKLGFATNPGKAFILGTTSIVTAKLLFVSVDGLTITVQGDTFTNVTGSVTPYCIPLTEDKFMITRTNADETITAKIYDYTSGSLVEGTEFTSDNIIPAAVTLQTYMYPEFVNATKICLFSHYTGEDARIAIELNVTGTTINEAKVIPNLSISPYQTFLSDKSVCHQGLYIGGVSLNTEVLFSVRSVLSFNPYKAFLGYATTAAAESSTVSVQLVDETIAGVAGTTGEETILNHLSVSTDRVVAIDIASIIDEIFVYQEDLNTNINPTSTTVFETLFKINNNNGGEIQDIKLWRSAGSGTFKLFIDDVFISEIITSSTTSFVNITDFIVTRGIRFKKSVEITTKGSTSAISSARILYGLY